MRVIECAELLAADLFKNADQTRQRITLGDVERHLAQLAAHPGDCRLWPLSVGAQGDGAAGLCDRQRLAASGAQDRDQAIAELLSKLAGDG